MKARIWLTGFEPFGEHVENPSKVLVERILGTSQTNEIKEILTTMNLELGMKIEGWPPENIDDLAKRYEESY